MLAVDVSFLAVPSVNVQDSQSVPVISTYISVFCTLGSLVVALLFLTNQGGSIDDVVSRVFGSDYTILSKPKVCRATSSIW
jgi:hypothetical protein